MPDDRTPEPRSGGLKTEYILVSDKTSRVLLSSLDRYEVVKMANMIRRGGGEVTVFKSTKM